MATDLSATNLPFNGSVTVGTTSYEAITLPPWLRDLWVYLDQDTGSYPTGLVSYSGGADAGVPFPAKVWTRVWRREPEIAHQGMIAYIKAGAAGQTLYYSSHVEPGGIGDVDINVDLDPATDGVLCYGSDDGGTNQRILLTDSGGRQVVIGSVADGSAVAHPPVLTAGQDGTNVQSIKTDSTGRQEVVGAAADGSAVAGAPVLVGGQDGTNAQSLLVDTSGRPRVVGAADDGSAKTGSPVLVAGQDGANAKTLLVDSTGAQVVVGAGADGAAVVGYPVRVAGKDGSGNTQDLAADTAGNAQVVGPGASGAARSGNPVAVAGSDGTNTRDLLTDTGGRARVVGAADDGAAPVGSPVLAAGSDGAAVQTLLVDSTGAQVAVGAAADGAAAVGAPVQVAGKDGAGNIESILTDTTGAPNVVGAGASGAARVGNPVAVAGSDGTNARDLLTDTSGRARMVGAADAAAAVAGSPVRIGASDGAITRDVLCDGAGQLKVVGAAADGAAVTGNPVLVAGQDGTNTQTLKTDTTGRQEVVGGAADGAALAGNPVPIAGVDGSGNVQSALVDTTGAQVVVGAAADGAAKTGNPVLVAGEDGTNAQTVKTDSDGHLQTDVLSSALPAGAATEATLLLVKAAVELIDDAVYTDGSGTVSKGLAVLGQDGTNPQAVRTDTTGRVEVVGGAADGAAVAGNPVPVAGVDGSGNVQTALVDTTGAQVVVGAAADGAAKTGNPVLVAGEDGTNAQTLKTDSDGHLQADVLSSALPSGAATLAEQQTQTTSLQLLDDAVYTDATGTPSKGIAVMGTDGTNPQLVAVDTTGRQIVVGGAADGAAVSGNPVLVAGADGSGNTQTILTDTDGHQQIDVLASALPSGASTLAEQQTQTTALQLIDDTVYTDGTGTPSKGLTVMGTDGVNPWIVSVDSAGRVVVVGAAADGAAKAGNPVLVAGEDGTNAQTLKTDSDGHLQTDVLSSALPSGASTLAEQQTQTTALQLIDDAVSTTGAAVPAKGIQATGTDGTNARALKTDTDGHLQVDILSDPALASGTDSIDCYGYDGAAARRLLTDDTGAQVVVGAAAGGQPIAGAPVLVGGMDGTGDAQPLLTDTSGALTIIGPAADGAAVAGNPVRVAGKDGSGNTQDVITDADGHLQVDVLSAAARSDATDSIAVYDAVKRTSGALTNDNGTTEVELTGFGANAWWYLHGAYFKRTAGTAANYQVRIAEDTGWTLGDIASERYDSGSKAVGTQLADQGTAGQGLWRLFQADAAGKLYFETGFDAGADNNATYIFDWRKARAA